MTDPGAPWILFIRGDGATAVSCNLTQLKHDFSSITTSLKAINSTLTIQEIARPTFYRIVVQTRGSSRPFFKGLSFLIHLTTRSSTLNPSPLLRKN